MDYSVVDLTYAADTDTLYAMVQEDETADQLIMTVNRSTGALTEVANLPNLRLPASTSLHISAADSSTPLHITADTASSSHKRQHRSRTRAERFPGVEQLTAVTYYPQAIAFSVCFPQHSRRQFRHPAQNRSPNGESEEIGAIGGGFGYSLTSIFPVPNVQISLPEVPDTEAMNAALNAQGSNLTFMNDGNAPWSFAATTAELICSPQRRMHTTAPQP